MSQDSLKGLTVSRFKDTIKRTIFIMIIAVVTMEILDFPLCLIALAVALGILVIIYSLIWIRRLKEKKSSRKSREEG